VNRTRLRLATALAAGAAVLVIAGGAIVFMALSRSLAEAAVDAGAAAQVRRSALVTLVLAGAALVAAAAFAGRALAGSLVRLRGAVLQRARGSSFEAPETSLHELHDLAEAAARLAERVSSRDAELERGGAELTTLLDSLSEGILQLDPKGRIVRANPSARTLLGMGRGGIGRHIDVHVRHAELRVLLQRVATENIVQSAEITMGDRRILVSGRPLDAQLEQHGGGAVVTIADLTEIRRLEGVRRDFVANVSHELKTPLTSIRGYVETLLGDDDMPADMKRQFLDVVHRNANRLNSIVEDLLDLSRLESGGWRPELLEVDAAEIVEDVWSGCSREAAQRHIRFTAPTPVRVLADPSGLRQVLANLLDNALRYTPDGGSIQVVALPSAAAAGPVAGAATDTAPGFVTLEVRDTGVGIPTDALTRVFERFYRVDPARSRAEGGTGLGLSIVKHLVESMGGTVSAHSELGKGTTIRFRLPAAD
jgi:two-component system, OmpR family, phosphate regulon sensor histidine kinase PhoR